MFSPADYLIPIWAVIGAQVLGLLALGVIYRLHNNRAFLGLMLASGWLTLSNILNAIGVVNDLDRTALLRVGQVLFQISLIGWASTVALRRRR